MSMTSFCGVTIDNFEHILHLLSICTLSMYLFAGEVNPFYSLVPNKLPPARLFFSKKTCQHRPLLLGPPAY